MSRTIEVICTLSEAKFRERRAWVREHIAAVLLSIEKTSDGLRLTYPADPDVRSLVEEFASLERRCCGGFLAFSFAGDVAEKQFDLLITGPAEVQDILFDLKRHMETERHP